MSKSKKYNPETEAMLAKVGEQGFNIWVMLEIFKRRSRLSVPIPDEVIQEVCKEYFVRGSVVNSGFPYFLTVLKQKSSQYFANKNVVEGMRIKKEPLALKDILKSIAESGGEAPQSHRMVITHPPRLFLKLMKNNFFSNTVAFLLLPFLGPILLWLAASYFLTGKHKKRLSTQRFKL